MLEGTILNRFNLVLQKAEEKLKMILDKPVSMSVLLGFVLGATLPTYALLASGKVELGDIGEWLGAIATFFAVWVSLYLARKSSKTIIKIRKNKFNVYDYKGDCVVDIVNLGDIDACIKLKIDIDNEYRKNAMSSFKNPDNGFNFGRELSNKLHEIILNDKKKKISPKTPISLKKHSGFTVSVDTNELDQWLRLEDLNQHGSYKLVLVVENIDGKIVTEQISKVQF
ncbi:hypothetical protein FIV27_15655 [Lactiplantibacillus plantarum]|nr:hypothetical protein [Lactiplantibacillus plantarum]